MTLFPWNLQYYNVPQSAFLAGTVPDAVIVCINAHDEIDVIERTVKFIESINHSHIIAFVLFPMERKALFGGGVIRSQRISLETIHEIRNQVKKYIQILEYLHWMIMTT